MKIGINQVFTLTFSISKFDHSKLDKILSINKINYDHCQTKMENILAIAVRHCSLRKAELIRQLLKNIAVYD